MAEIEIHHEVEHESDSFGRRIGLIAAIIGVVLAFDTIASHRAHTEAVVKKTEANDEWAYYQSKSIKRVQYVVASELAKGMNNAAAAPTLEKFAKEQERYKKESDESQKKAEEIEAEVKAAEGRALRYDVGEGLLELGLVLSSLYFISKRRIFPYIGVPAAALGCVIGASGLLIH